MPDNQRFPIPDDLTPDTYCLCIPMPNDPTWRQTIVGLLAQPTYWFNWDRDEARSGKELAAYWTKLFDEIDWSIMSCCCDQPPAIFRYGPGAIYQRSTDGGVTWVDAPSYDYRNTSITYPDPADLGIDTSKCQGADSVKVVIDEQIIQQLNEDFAAGQILALIAAVLAVFLSAGSLGAFAPLIAAIGAAIVDVGVSATQAAFTSDVWNRFRCNVYCHMSSDSAIDAAGFAAILAQIASDESGIVEIVLWNTVNAAGVVGLTNMIRSNVGDPDADCSECCPVAEIWQTNSVGALVQLFPDDDGLYTVTGDFFTSGKYYANVQFSGTPDGTLFIPCNNITIMEDDPARENYLLKLRCHDGVPDSLSSCDWLVQMRGNSPWSIKVALDAECS